MPNFLSALICSKLCGILEYFSDTGFLGIRGLLKLAVWISKSENDQFNIAIQIPKIKPKDGNKLFFCIGSIHHKIQKIYKYYIKRLDLYFCTSAISNNYCQQFAVYPSKSVMYMYMQVYKNVSTYFIQMIAYFTCSAICFLIFFELFFTPVYRVISYVLLGTYVQICPNLTSLISMDIVVVSGHLLVQTDAGNIQHAISEDVLGY